MIQITDEKIGERIFKATRVLKIDISTLSEIISEPESVLEDVQKGTFRLEIIKLCRIADHLGVSLDWLILGRSTNVIDYFIDTMEGEDERN